MTVRKIKTEKRRILRSESRVINSQFEYKIPKMKLMIVRETDSFTELYQMESPEDVEEYVEPLKHASEEYFFTFHLNAKNYIVGFHEVSHGTLSSSLVHPREVYKSALLSNAASIIAVHNHPTGSLTPSFEDLSTTKNLIEAGQIIGVNLLDHVIVSFKGSYSIREKHPEIFLK